MAKHSGAGSRKASPSLVTILTEVKASLSKNDIRQASRLLADADKLFPGSAAIQAGLGNVYLSTNRAPEAEVSFRQALILDPNLIEAATGLVKALMALGNLPQAESEARGFLVKYPNDLTLGLLISQALIDQGRLRDAVEFLRQVVTAHPTSVPAVNSLAKRLSEVGEFEASRKTFELAIQLDPTNAFAYLGWAQAKKIGGEDLGMVRAMERAATVSTLTESERIQLLFAIGKSYDDLAKFEEAMRSYREANSLRDQVSSRTNPFQPAVYEELFKLTQEIFTKETIARLKTTYESNPTPIFIVGMFRSGTTLVEQILSSHSHIAAGGEIQYWLDASAGCFNHPKHTFDFPRAVALRRPYQRQLVNYSATASYVTDKMPGNYRVLGLLRILFPKAKFIHCVRHPADICLSIFMTAFNTPPNYASDPEKLIYTYRLYQRTMNHWKAVLGPGEIHEIRYEDLVKDPEAIIRALISFCGLDLESGCLAPEKNNRSVSTASIWQARQPIYRTATEKWRRYEPWLNEFRQLLEV